MIVKLKERHREDIRKMLETVGNFTPAEVTCALELVDEALASSVDYIVDVYETDGKAAGFVCYGTRSLTEGVWELYWIAVAKEQQNKGIGSALSRHLEKAVRNKARMIIAETSSQEKYEGTHKFYLSNGYREEARIKDFYKEGDDLIIFVRRL